jgi:two-component system sensor histidine kinase ChvG
VLVVTTAAGEIDQLVRGEREELLQMFVVALFVSIGLSFVLASTIANPLSDLAAAAELGRDKNAPEDEPDACAHPRPHRAPRRDRPAVRRAAGHGLGAL